MKLFIVLAALVVAVSALTPQQKEDLFNTNLHHIGNLDAKARNCVTEFLKDLGLQETYIALDQTIKNGHSVMYHFKEGKTESIKETAEKHKLSIEPSNTCKCQDCCGRIVLPGGDIVEANTVAGKRQDRANMPSSGGEEKKEEEESKPEAEAPFVQDLQNANRTNHGKVPLTATQKQWYYDNNVAQTSKMDATAAKYVKQLLADIKANAPSTVIQLLTPIPQGHAVRFTVVEGNAEDVSAQAGKCGVKIDGKTIVAPSKDAVIGTAEDTMEADKSGHLIAGHLEQNDAGVPKKLSVVDSAKRNVVPTLKDKWIKTPALVEEAPKEPAAADDSDAFIDPAAAPVKGDDGDAFVALYSQVTPKADDADAFVEVTPVKSEDADSFIEAAPVKSDDADSFIEAAPAKSQDTDAFLAMLDSDSDSLVSF